ncbi:glycosyltransferase family 4 protein [Paenibacillus soyae]|uniref:Glycosyltransferase family 4 protein n=1 Tax=Paenibacillus soyae TaxID=2969249 RepID=A0A9X2MMB3_9BACL|nr:glycosyltransferase family 4 protein [Paenibacillus soyae]MCR2803276.1 glycosyltransferase family 4 protein [Paenibacillus soyae]
MKKMMFITNRLPFPNTDGRKNLLQQYIQQVKDIYPECRIVNLSFVDDKKYLEHKPDAIARLESLELPGMLEKLFNALVYSLLMRKWPLQVSVYYSRRTHRRIKQLIEEEQPEFIFYDMVRVAEYVADGTGQRVLSYDDLLSLRYERQLQWFRYIPSVFGGFSDKLPSGLKRFADLKFIQKWLIAFESKLLHKYEKHAARHFQHLIFTSPKEAETFRQIVSHRSCLGIPMRFDPDGQSAGNPRPYDRNKLVFVGKMDIPHNSSACVFFCEKIWPSIKRKAPDATFYIIGKNPTAEVLRLQQTYPGVIVTGEVDDVKRVVSDAALMIAPLLFGTGIKTKIVEAMSWGVPVVTNPIGSEGINAINHEDLFVSETDEEMVRNVLLLLNDKEMNEKVSRNSIRYVSRHFSSSVTRKNLELILSYSH